MGWAAIINHTCLGEHVERGAGPGPLVWRGLGTNLNWARSSLMRVL